MGAKIYGHVKGLELPKQLGKGSQSCRMHTTDSRTYDKVSQTAWLLV